MEKYFKSFGLVLLLFSFSTAYAGERIVVIDVGHGGNDEGFSIDGHKEKELVFEIALKIVALNKSEDLKIVLTREGDYPLSLADRAEFINSLNPDYVISLHINSDKDISSEGFDFFISTENSLSEKSRKLANHVEKFVLKEFSSNGIKNGSFSILKNVFSPMTIIEMGYLSNPNDFALLTSKEGQDKIAEVIYNTIK